MLAVRILFDPTQHVILKKPTNLKIDSQDLDLF